MPSPKSLAVAVIERTTDALVRDIKQLPMDRWRESAGGEANDLFGILKHLVECEDWWLINIGIPEGERPLAPDLDACQSAEDMVEHFRKARRHLAKVLRALPDSFYETRFPSPHYGRLKTGADLILYAAEHDFYHIGQINMLMMALR